MKNDEKDCLSRKLDYTNQIEEESVDVGQFRIEAVPSVYVDGQFNEILAPNILQKTKDNALSLIHI